MNAGSGSVGAGGVSADKPAKIEPFDDWISRADWLQGKDGEKRSAMMTALAGFINAGGVQVSMSGHKDTRSVRSNALGHVWARDVAVETGESEHAVFARWKLDELLKMKIGDKHAPTRKRGEFEALILDRVRERDLKIATSYDLIRSKILPSELFRTWLTRIQFIEAEQGRVLVAKKSDSDLLKDEEKGDS